MDLSFDYHSAMLSGLSLIGVFAVLIYVIVRADRAESQPHLRVSKYRDMSIAWAEIVRAAIERDEKIMRSWKVNAESDALQTTICLGLDNNLKVAVYADILDFGNVADVKIVFASAAHKAIANVVADELRLYGYNVEAVSKRESNKRVRQQAKLKACESLV